MTDNEIIKGLERCIRNDLKECKICQYGKLGQGCRAVLRGDILDLINRQKAEIDELKMENGKLKIAKSEAIKEFAKELSEKTLTQKEEYIRVMEENHPAGSKLWEFWHGKKTEAEQTLNRIDDLVKEMT